MPYTSAWHLPSNSVRPNTSALSVHLLQHFTFFKSLVTKPEMHWCTSHPKTYPHITKKPPLRNPDGDTATPILKIQRKCAQNIRADARGTVSRVSSEQNEPRPGLFTLFVYRGLWVWGYDSIWLTCGRASLPRCAICLPLRVLSVCVSVFMCGGRREHSHPRRSLSCCQ